VSGNFWDTEVVARRHVAWRGIWPIREYINQLIGGDVPRFAVDWFERWLGGRVFRRVLDIGCGDGTLDRQLVERGIALRVDALDGSLVSLQVAQRAARAEGFGDRIRYFNADFNLPAFPRARYDAVFFQQSAHHIAALEDVFDAVRLALKPNGLVYLDEYIGPSRADWNDALIAPHRREFEALPAEVRLTETLPLPIQDDDPTEAVRSSDIERVLRERFDVIERRPYGGSLLAVIVPNMRDAENAVYEQLIEREKALIAGGTPHYHAIIIAKLTADS
jgi:SAM-dependent methyltransferase